MAKPKVNKIVKKTEPEVVKENKTVEIKKVSKMNPPFDPDIPEQKQRWLR